MMQKSDARHGDFSHCIHRDVFFQSSRATAMKFWNLHWLGMILLWHCKPCCLYSFMSVQMPEFVNRDAAFLTNNFQPTWVHCVTRGIQLELDFFFSCHAAGGRKRKNQKGSLCLSKPVPLWHTALQTVFFPSSAAARLIELPLTKGRCCPSVLPWLNSPSAEPSNRAMWRASIIPIKLDGFWQIPRLLNRGKHRVQLLCFSTTFCWHRITQTSRLASKPQEKSISDQCNG